jgi:hypothetical protein
MQVKTHVVNLIGGPGVGKTTMAHLLVYLASVAGLRTAFVPEYVKSWALEERPFRPYDELYFLGPHGEGRQHRLWPARRNSADALAAFRAALVNFIFVDGDR